MGDCTLHHAFLCLLLTLAAGCASEELLAPSGGDLRAADRTSPSAVSDDVRQQPRDVADDVSPGTTTSKQSPGPISRVPEIAFLTPGDACTNPVLLTVTVSGSVNRVQYYADGYFLGTSADFAKGFALQYPFLDVGVRQLEAHALDVQDNVVATAQRTTTVSDPSVAGTIQFVAPGAVATNPVTLQVATTGAVHHVRYLVDGIVLGIAEDGPSGFPLTHEFWGSGVRVLEARGFNVDDVLVATAVQQTLIEPQIDLAFTKPGATCQNPVVLEVAASGPVHWVQYLVDGLVIDWSEQANNQFAVVHVFAAGGEHLLEARAYGEDNELLALASMSTFVLVEEDPNAPTGCPPGKQTDCNGFCADETWVGDGICDDGTLYVADFDCPAWNHDGGDCAPGQPEPEPTTLAFVSPAAETVTNPVTFRVAATGDVHQVDYHADGYFLGSCDNAASQYEVTYTFNMGGERVIVASAYNAEGQKTATATRVLYVDLGPDPDPDPPADGLPDVPYFYQYSNSLSPSASCQNTSVAMLLAWYGWSGTPDTITGEWGKNYAQSPAGLAEVFNHYAQQMGIPQRLVPHTNGTVSGLKGLLSQGLPVIIHGYFTSYGHVMVTLGYEQGHYTVNDPAGTWNQQFKGGYPYGWQPTAGDHIEYGAASFEKAVATWDGFAAAPLWYHEIVTD